MSSPFLAEIRIFAVNFAPKGWAFCDGQLLPLSQNTALFSLLGTTYGGDGKSNFALPNFQGMAPMQQGQGPGLSMRDLGEQSGEEALTLLESEMPAHTHGAQGVSGAGGQSPAPGTTWADANQRGVSQYAASGTSNVAMSPLALSSSGGSQPHNNMMPYLMLNFCIALQGVYPARN